MKRSLYIVLLIWCCMATAQADDAVMTGLHCGQVVRLTATPDPGYTFVGWSDGVQDNPRYIEVEEAVTVQALYERTCDAHYVIPLLYLYNEVIMIDLHQLKTLDYNPAEEDVHWYRIVGDMDDIFARRPDDVLEASGYAVNRYTLPSGEYYVQAAIPPADTDSASGEPSDTDCPEILRSQPISIIGLDTSPVESDEQPNTCKFLQDNKLFIKTADHIYDAVGHRVL